MIMHRQVQQSCADPVIDVRVVPRLQFFDRVCLPRREQRQVPQLLRVVQFKDKVAFNSWVVQRHSLLRLHRQGRRCASGHTVSGVPLMRLEEFHNFLRARAVRMVFFYVISTNSLYLAALAPVRCDSPLRLWDEILAFST